MHLIVTRKDLNSAGKTLPLERIRLEHVHYQDIHGVHFNLSDYPSPGVDYIIFRDTNDPLQPESILFASTPKKPAERRYIFDITLNASASSPEEAWERAIENLSTDHIPSWTIDKEDPHA